MSALNARKLNVESLEAREVLSGNVAVSVVGGDLVVTGDSAGNLIQIRQLSASTFTVMGTGTGTTVNGSLFNRTFFGVVDDIRVSMNGGSDRVDIRGASTSNRLVVRTDLVINAGSGHDRVTLDALHVRDDVFVETGSGNNAVTANQLLVGDDMSVTKNSQNTGDADKVSVKSTTVGAAGQGNLLIDLFDGADQVYLWSVATDGLNIKTRGGNDYVSTVFTRRDSALPNRIDAGSGFDTVNTARNSTYTAPNSNIDVPRTAVERVTRFDVLPPVI